MDRKLIPVELTAIIDHFLDASSYISSTNRSIGWVPSKRDLYLRGRADLSKIRDFDQELINLINKQYEKYPSKFLNVFEGVIRSLYVVNTLSFRFGADAKNMVFLLNFLETQFSPELNKEWYWLIKFKNEILKDYNIIKTANQINSKDKHDIVKVIILFETFVSDHYLYRFIQFTKLADINRGIMMCKNFLNLNAQDFMSIYFNNQNLELVAHSDHITEFKVRKINREERNSSVESLQKEKFVESVAPIPLQTRMFAYLLITNNMCNIKQNHTNITIPVKFPNAWENKFFELEGVVCIECHHWFDHNMPGHLEGISPFMMSEIIADFFQLVGTFFLIVEDKHSGEQNKFEMNYAKAELSTLTPAILFDRILRGVSIPPAIEFLINGEKIGMDEFIGDTLSDLQEFRILSEFKLFRTELSEREEIGLDRLDTQDW